MPWSPEIVQSTAQPKYPSPDLRNQGSNREEKVFMESAWTGNPPPFIRESSGTSTVYSEVQELSDQSDSPKEAKPDTAEKKCIVDRVRGLVNNSNTCQDVGSPNPTLARALSIGSSSYGPLESYDEDFILPEEELPIALEYYVSPDGRAEVVRKFPVRELLEELANQPLDQKKWILDW